MYRPVKKCKLTPTVDTLVIKLTEEIKNTAAKTKEEFSTSLDIIYIHNVSIAKMTGRRYIIVNSPSPAYAYMLSDDSIYVKLKLFFL